MWSLADKYNVLTPERGAEFLMKRLRQYKPYVYKKSKNRGSVYIHFHGLPNNLNHKLRVSDHEERDRYGYKWQLRLDGLRKIKNKKPQRRYFETIDELVESFDRYYLRVTQLNKELLEEYLEEEEEWATL